LKIRIAVLDASKLIIPIDLKALKATMPTTTPTILDQINADKMEGSTMKRVEGVEDLNSRIICAQGIVGVGAIIRTCT
jgi:hypothetical protein